MPTDVAEPEITWKDMLHRGYALFVETGTKKKSKLRKVKAFDPKTCEYIIADGPLYAGDDDPPRRVPKKKTTTRRVGMTRSNVTGVAPTSGG